MTVDEFRAIALSFPGVEDGTSYRLPALLAYGKFFTRLRAEDASLVLMEMGFDEREMLIEAEPRTFHVTPHYQNSSAVLARLASLDSGALRGFLERRWRKVAPKKVVKAWEAERG